MVLYPATVQGIDAAPTIVKGIKALDVYGVDTIIVGRGGGSMEDLWAFNEEIVAKAIFECKTPIISAVGHETDTTIADFVSDMRAPTPSAAAELAVPDIREIESLLGAYEDRLDNLMVGKVHLWRQYMEQYRLRLDSLSPASQIREKRMHLIALEEKLNQRIAAVITGKRHQAQMYSERLAGLSPMARLLGGYAFVTHKDGKLVRSVKQVKENEELKLSVADGDIYARVTSVEINDTRREQ